MILSPEERRRFVAYCRHEEQSSSEMAKQIESLPGMPAELVRRYKVNDAAHSLVANDLEKAEIVEIKSTDV